MKGRTMVLLGISIAVIGGVIAYAAHRAAQYEEALRRAEQYDDSVRVEIARLRLQRDSLRAQADRRDTVIVRQVKEVAAIDLSNPPPDTCRPNLAARDALLATQGAQIDNLREQISVLGDENRLLEGARDSLRTALAKRPGFVFRLPGIEIGKPEFGAFIGYCGGGYPCAGAGVILPFRLRV